MVKPLNILWPTYHSVDGFMMIKRFGKSRQYRYNCLNSIIKATRDIAITVLIYIAASLLD